MRPSSYCFWAALLLLVGICAAQGPDCNAAIVTLLPCLDYVQGNVSSPSASCCTGLASVVQTSPSCLCVLANDSALPIRVDPVRATQLPAVCNVTSPTVIVCGGAVAPVGIPVSSPSVSAPAAVPVVAPVAGTPPVMAPSVSKTPAMAPSTPPATVPSTTPTTPPTVSPTVAPAVAPAVSPPPAPTAEVPVPAPATTPPTGAPTSAPSSSSPIPALSSPPAPPPNGPPNGSHGVAIAASLVMSGFAMVLSSFLLQM